MVHLFKARNKIFVVDSNSGSIFELDEPAGILIAQKLNKQFPFLPVSVSPEQLEQAELEINALINEGVLFATDDSESSLNSFIVPKTQTNVKALCLNVAHDCNLRCKYCFAGEGDYYGNKLLMPFEVAKNAVDLLIKESGNRKNLEIDFFGGEPLLNLDVVKKTVSYATERAGQTGKRFRFTITTNCVALNKETAHYLNHVMANVVLSIDGRPEVHNGVRRAVNGKDLFEHIISNALYFASIRGSKDYFVRGTYTNLNLDFSNDIKYLLDRGFKKLSLEPVVLPSDHTLAIREEQLPRIYQEYDRLSQLYLSEHRAGRGFVFFHYMMSFDNAPCLRKVVTACGAGCEYLAIDPNGDCYPCHQFVGREAFKLGTVFGGDLNRELMAMLRDSTVYTKPECKKCFAKYFCSGGCLANNQSFCGSIDIPHEISCKIIRKRIENAISVQWELANAE